jgi:O-antigen/teichoic acid export membrane protein
MIKSVSRIYRNFQSDSLFRNSVYLMMSSSVMAVLGFLFWMLCARLFSPAEIGLGTTLISTMSLISYVSLLGFNTTLIRFLPGSNDRNAEINSGLVLVGFAAAVLAGGFIGFMPWLAPDLTFVRESVWQAAGFVIIGMLAAASLLSESVFVAYRAANYNLIISLVMSGAKLVLPMALVGFGAYGVYFSSGAAAAVALLLSTWFMVRRFEFRPRLEVSRRVVRRVLSFSSANYAANLLNILPTLVLPAIILNQLGAEQAGFFYLAFMIANLLYTIAYAVAQSLFAEGSHVEQALWPLVRRAVAILTAIIVPASMVMALVAPRLLMLLGDHYSVSAGQALVALAWAAPVLAFYTVANVILKINKRIYSTILINMVFASLIIGLSMLWVAWGLVWVAIAWAIGHFLSGTMGFALAMLPQRYWRGSAAVRET